MNKLMMVAGAAMVGAMVGCVSTKGGNDPVGQWQKDRFAADKVLELQKQNKLPVADDVAVKSTMSTKTFVDAIEAFDTPFAEMYSCYIKDVDELYAKSEGRIVFQDVMDAVADNKSTYEDEIAKLEPADKKLLDEYYAYTQNVKIDQALLSRLSADAAKVAAGAAQVAALVSKIKSSPEFTALTGFALVKESGALGVDATALKDQLNSISAGIQLRQALVEQDKRAKEYASKR